MMQKCKMIMPMWWTDGMSELPPFVFHCQKPGTYFIVRTLWKGHHIFPISHLKWVVQMTWANFSFAGMLLIWSGYYTLELEDTPATGLLTARFPRLICTEMLAWDKSTPELWRAWVNELSNLLQIKEKKMYQHTFIFGKDNKSLIAHA